MSDLQKAIRTVPDFPKPGVLFRDITPLLHDHLNASVEAIAGLFSTEEWEEISTIIGIEARGFIFASTLAVHLRKRLRLIRKAGKLPPPVVRESYTLEYGRDNIEMQPGQGPAILIDDVLATGGTLRAAADLSARAGYHVQGFACLIDICHLNDFHWNGLRTRSLIQY